jgi:WD40 repeat protein
MSPNADATCPEIEPLIAARLIGALAAAEEERLLRHLESCRACFVIASELERDDLGDVLHDGAMAAVDDFASFKVVEPENYIRGMEVGRGGMGRIVHARDRRLGRPVVLKELLDAALDERFEEEARLTARLQHPAIVNVLEAGRWPSGAPFYAMKYVAGRPLDRVIEDTKSLADRLALVPHLVTVAEAVAYAHEQGIIHRDLKPANVLVGPFGETVVIDWGLAKDLRRPPLTERNGPYREHSADLTHLGAGTPHYMPPEQAAGQSADERVDVYALGATLYHLLAGCPPYAGLSAREVISSLSLGPPLALAHLVPGVPPALLTIVEKAMARTPAARYPTAKELAADLLRFQTGQLVAAHRYTLHERTQRLVRRHRIPFVIATLAMVVIVATGAISLHRVIQARRDAEIQLAELLVERGQQELVRGAPTRGLVYLAAAFDRGADSSSLRVLLDEAARSVESLEASFTLSGVRPVAARVSPLGSRLVTVSRARGVLLWDAATGALVADLLPARGGRPLIAFSPDGLVLLGARSCDGARLGGGSCITFVHLWDGLTGRLRAILPHVGPVEDTRFAASDIVTVGDRGEHVWNGSTGLLKQVNPGRSPPRVPPGTLRVDAADHVSVTVSAEAPSIAELAFLGKPSRQLSHRSPIALVRVSPDTRTVLTAGSDGSLRLWDIATGIERASFEPSEGAIVDAEIDTANRVISVSEQGSVKVWRAGGRFLGSHEMGATITGLSFSPRGQVLATNRKGHAAVLHREGTLRTRIAHPHHLADVAAFRDEDSVTLGHEKRISRWNLVNDTFTSIDVTNRAGSFGQIDPSGDVLLDSYGTLVKSDGQVLATIDGDRLVFDASGRRIAGLVRDAAGQLGAGLWDGRSGRLLARHPVERLPNRLGEAVIAAGRSLVVRGHDRSLHVWDMDSGRERARLTGESTIEHVALSPDGDQLLISATHGGATLWDADGVRGTHLAVNGVTSAAFSHDGTRVLVGARDGWIHVFTTDVGTRIASVGPVGGPVSAVALSKDDTRAAVASGSTLTIWDMAVRRRSRDEVRSLTRHLPLSLESGRLVTTRPMVRDEDEVSAERRAWRHFDEGISMLLAGKADEAVSSFSAAHAEDPEPAYLLYQALVLDDPERLEVALAEYQARRTAPLSSAFVAAIRSPGGMQAQREVMFARFERGVDLYERRRYAEAAAEFMTAYAAVPIAKLLFNAAVCYEKLERPEIAAMLFRRYLDETPAAADRLAIENRIAALESPAGRSR